MKLLRPLVLLFAVYVLISCSPFSDGENIIVETELLPPQSTEQVELIVYIEEDDISIMETSGRKIENITSNRDNDYSYNTPKWNPSGSKIAFIQKLNTDKETIELIIVDFPLDGNFYYDPILNSGEEFRIESINLYTRKVIHSFNFGEINNKEWVDCTSSEIGFDWISDSAITFFCQSETESKEGLTFCTWDFNATEYVTEDNCIFLDHPNPESPFSELDYSSQKQTFLISGKGEKIYHYNPKFETLEYLFDGQSPAWDHTGSRIAYSTGKELIIYSFINNYHKTIYNAGEMVTYPFELSDKEFAIEWWKNFIFYGEGITWGNGDMIIYFTAR